MSQNITNSSNSNFVNRDVITGDELVINESILKIRNAVVTDFTVEYSAGTQNPTFFKDTGAPLSVTLNVTVKETEIYTKERLLEDYPKYSSELKPKLESSD